MHLHKIVPKLNEKAAILIKKELISTKRNKKNNNS